MDITFLMCITSIFTIAYTLSIRHIISMYSDRTIDENAAFVILLTMMLFMTYLWYVTFRLMGI